jgi:NAD(P)-dependent dehydrogenase (short-subunit alcohol dehydrogenase family)
MSSLASCFATPAHSIYSASKGALISFSKCLALEVALQRIRVNCILPGMIRTNMMQGGGNVTTEELLKDEKRYPLGRYGNPGDVANLVVYLLSDASEWMTGSIINIDGGISLR